MNIEDAKAWDLPPPNARSLGKRIHNLADKVGIEPDLMEVAFAQVVLGQILPGVLRGGAALKIGLGPFGSRFSSDADLVLPHDLVPDSFEEWINERKKEWGRFRVEISVRKRDARPEGVPPDHVIRTYPARVSYGDSEWRSLKLEVGRDEVGGFERPVERIAEEWTTYIRKIGLETLRPLLYSHTRSNSFRRSTAARGRIRRATTSGLTTSWTSSLSCRTRASSHPTYTTSLGAHPRTEACRGHR